jgi:hypothetical protein
MDTLLSMIFRDKLVLFILVIGFVPAVVSCLDLYAQGKQESENDETDSE